MPIPAKPVGNPHQRDDDRVAALLLIDDHDFGAAEKMWRMHAPYAYRGLLNGAFAWNPKTQMYTDRHGGRLDGAHMKRLGVMVNAAVRMEMQDHARDMATGITTIDAWEDRQAEDVKSIYLAMVALADGGFDKITNADKERLTVGDEAWLRFSLERLQAFASDVAIARDTGPNADGKLPDMGTVEEIVNRAGMYADSANGVYEEQRTDSHKRATDSDGVALYLFERNILAMGEDVDHCQECPEISAAGWQPIGSLPRIGERECLMRCLCGMEYSLRGNNP